MIRRARSNEGPVEIDRGGGPERVQRGGGGRHGGAKDHGHEQTDNSMRHLLKNESDKNVVGLFALRIGARLIEHLFGLLAEVMRTRIQLTQPRHVRLG